MVLITLFLLIPASFILAILAFHQIQQLKKRIEILEKQLMSRPSPSIERPLLSSEESLGLTEVGETSQPVPVPVTDVSSESAHEPGKPLISAEISPQVTSVSESRRTSRPSLEAWLGGRVFVLVGAVALALAVVYLIRLTLERGWITPPIRIIFGTLFGLSLCLLGIGKRDRWGYLAGGLVASGIASLYITLFGATEIYHFLNPFTGLSLVVAITVAAILLSLRHGMIVVIVGLIGGFLAPYLFHLETPSMARLTLYLLFLQSGVLLVTFTRKWPIVRLFSLLGGYLWALFLLLRGPLTHPGWPGFYLFTLSVLYLVSETFFSGSMEEKRRINFFALFMTLLGFSLFLIYVPRGGFSFVTWTYTLCLYAAVLLLSFIRAPVRAIPWFGLPVLIGFYEIEVERGLYAGPTGWVVGGGLFILILLMPLVVSLIRERSGGSRRIHAIRLAVIGAIFWFAADYVAVYRAGLDRTWWIPCTVAIVLFGGRLAVAVRRDETEGRSLLAMATGLFFFLLPFMHFERFPLTLLFALQIPVYYLASRWARDHSLEWFGRFLTVWVVLRFLLQKNAYETLNLKTPFINQYAYLVAIPLIVFLFTAMRLVQTVLDRKLLNGAVLTIGWFWMLVNLRLVYHGSTYLDAPLHFYEWGASFTVSGVYAVALVMWNRRLSLNEIRMFTRVIMILSLALFYAANLLLKNPLWNPVKVGTNFPLNHLIEGYALPSAVFLLWASVAMMIHEIHRLRTLFRATGLLGLFVFINLEIRQWFHGEDLSRGGIYESEKYVYSAVWLAFGLLLLVWGILFKQQHTRHASLVILVMTIFKVFVYDMAELPELYRIFSFLGLGLALFSVAYVYRRFVFRPGAGSTLPEENQGSTSE